MTVNLCVVSGTLVAPDGSPLPEVQVQFLPAPVAVRGRSAQSLAPRPVAVKTDAAAALNVSLAPGVYSVRTREPGGREYDPYLIEVPARDSAELVEIMQNLPAPQSVYDAAASARTAANAAAEALTQAGRAGESATLLVTSGARVFASRAEFEATDLPAETESWIVLQSGRALGYRRDPAGTAIQSANGIKGSPAGTVHPDHWAENAMPGSTDMTAALAAALAFAPRVQLLPADYRLGETIRVYARNGAVLEGEGIRSRLVADSGGWNLFEFFTGETGAGGVPLGCQGVVMRNLRISNSGTERTGGFFVTFEERCLRGMFENLWLDNCWGGLDLTAAAYTYVVNVQIEAGSRVTTGGPALRFSSNEAAGIYNPNAAANGAKCTDVHVRGLQINPQNATLPNPFSEAVLIESADGIYFHECHLRGGTNSVVMRTALAPNRTVIASVDFNGVYFDGVEGSHVRFEGYGNDHVFTPVGASGTSKVKFRSITFNGCRFRASKALTGAITFSNMAAGDVGRVSIMGGQVRDNWYTAIRAASGGTGGAFGLTVQGVEFSGNNTQGDALHGDIVLRDNGHAIRANDFKPSDINTDVGRHVRLLVGPGGSSVSGNGFTLSPITDPARRIEVPETVAVGGNIGMGLSPSEVVSQGSNASGSWIRHADGRQVVTRRLTLTGQDVNTSYGTLFRSGDLVSAGLGNHLLAQPFAEGTVPVFSIAARVDNYPSMMILASAGSRTAWPSTVRVATPVALSNRTIHLDLRAEGRWKP